MSSIEEIAGVHLGKAGDGSAVKPYITPDSIDPSLLVRIPRQLNRTQYDLNEASLPFRGFDTWNCYEVSFLLNNGFPVSAVAKIVYPANSTYIVESKALKLYLNSFNMHKCGDNVDQAREYVAQRVVNDLSPMLGCDVQIGLFLNDGLAEHSPVDDIFIRIENVVEVNKIEFPWYNENADILQMVPNKNVIPFQVRSNSLRSNCRVTNQPDWGDVFIYMDSDFVPSLESLLQYIVSMRKENHFHEEICECIYKRLLDKFAPRELFVACLYTRRGGIDINPVRASNTNLLSKYAGNLMTPSIRLKKTMRQ